MKSPWLEISAEFALACLLVSLQRACPQVRSQLAELGLSVEQCDSIVSVSAIASLEELEARLGADSACVADLRGLWSIAEGYGIVDWL